MTKKVVYKEKVRDVVVINKPSDNYFALDLSEYPENEKDYYEQEYLKLHDSYLKQIKELGLSSNYRYFNKDKIEFIEDETA
ncbi:MAG: hypothetical protein GY707_05565 [Desulfobacteraceae bacterium]|nr:hypothetical protein [Desulfobacteraceae bacterium]